MYGRQCEIGPRRQPRHASRFSALSDELLKIGRTHPYALTSTDLSTLMAHPVFSEVGNGLPAKLPATGYIYRLTSAMNLVTSTDWTATPGGENTDFDIWQELAFASQRQGDGWVPLGSYARGLLRGFRGATWWSTIDDLVTDPVTGAHRLGIVNDWIPSFGVVLRCKVTSVVELPRLTVPDIIDGFAQEIFHPTRDEDGPLCGITIHLETASSVRLGVEEYIAPPLDVHAIELHPVHITRPMKNARAIWLGQALWDSLCAFYANLS